MSTYITIDQFTTETSGYNTAGVICTRAYSDTLTMDHMEAIKKDGYLVLTSGERQLELELDGLLSIERTLCTNGQTEYEITTILGMITLDVMNRKGA